MLLPTNDEACLISLTSGIFFLFTGVGTVTINTLQSLISQIGGLTEIYQLFLLEIQLENL